VLWSIGGLALALVIRPDRASFPGAAWVTAVDALGSGRGIHLFQSAQELAPLAPMKLVELCLVPCALIGLLGLVGRREGHAASRPIRVAALLATGATSLLCLRSARFADYLVPLACLAMAAWAPRRVPRQLAMRVTVGASALVAMLMITRGVQRAWRFGDAYIAPPESYERIASAIRTQVPSGNVIVTEDLIMTSVLWSYAPEYRYIGAYDPSTLYAAHPDLYWRWLNMVQHGRDCDQPGCPSGPPDVQQIVNVIHAFGSEHFVSFYPRPGYTVLSTMHAHPERFELLATAPAPVGRLSLWRVKPAATDAEWNLIAATELWTRAP
jgi:hypothetical protein